MRTVRRDGRATRRRTRLPRDCDAERVRRSACTATARSSAPSARGSRVRDDLAALLPRVEVASVDASTDEVPDVAGAGRHRGGAAPARRSRRARASGPSGLVAFLELDQELLAPRVRAAEQALWLLVRGGPPARRRPTAARCSSRPGCPSTRWCGRRAGAIRWSSPAPSAPVARALGFPPFGGLAEVSGARGGGGGRVRGGRRGGRHRARPGGRRDPGARARARASPRCATRWPLPEVEAARRGAGSGSTSIRAGSDHAVAGGSSRYLGGMYPLRLFGDPVLKQRAREVEELDGDLVPLVHGMYETMDARRRRRARGPAGRGAQAPLHLRPPRGRRPARS